MRLSFAFIVGIVCFDHFPLLWTFPFSTSFVLLLCLALAILYAKRKGFYAFRHLTGSIALIAIIFLGGFFTKFQYHQHSPHHYSEASGKIIGFSGTVVSSPTERTNHFRYDLQLNAIVSIKESLEPSEGKIHLYIRKDSLVQQFDYGDELLIKGSFYSISGPDNPNEFNYQKYLERQNIYSHAFVGRHDVEMRRNNATNALIEWAFLLRKSANQIIDRTIPSPRENAIAKALLLGIKDHLDNDIKQAYSAAGAMHVLAVSGLHVGIVFLILKILLGKLVHSGRYGKVLFGILTVSLIWLYAMVTGLSPSVLRAASMFSLIAISQSNAREGNIYNTLGVAAFLLLTYDPYLIYSVGFQLSFAAVVGIVYLQPKFYQLIDFNSILLDRAWVITCVSIAAQLSTFPLSAYYFHQFPTYFLVSNLFVIPAAFLMVSGGVIMLVADPLIPIASDTIGHLLEAVIWCVNELILYIESLPKSLIKWISMDFKSLLLTYLIVASLIAGLHYRSFKTLFVSFLLGTSLISWIFYTNYQQSRKKELIFYEIRNKIAVDYINGLHASLYIDSATPEELELLSFQINPNRLANHLDPIDASITDLSEGKMDQKESLRFGQIGGQRIIIFDSTTFHLQFTQKIESDIILINNESVKSFEWLLKHFQTKQLIIGNQNSIYYSKRMKQKAEELGVKIHSLKEDGALLIDLKRP